MRNVFNFSAGPSMMPEEVLLQAKDELLDWHGCGVSVLEMSHRGKTFLSIAEKLEADLRDLMKVPDHYKVLFLQGGATAQFAMAPLNLLRNKGKACYVETGSWSAKAIKEAKRYCEVVMTASSAGDGYTTIPDLERWNIDEDAAYLHITTNETIHGVEFQETPDAKGLPLVADMSSNILSRPVDVDRFGLIYAGAQKNMGPAGVTVVIVREDLIGLADERVPEMFNYQPHSKNDSMLNTPPTFNWYLVGLVLEWLIRQGGVEAIERRNIAKSEKLYQAIDRSSLFRNVVDARYRSRMNIPFLLSDTALEGEFLTLADQNGLIALKGHRSVGGMRASIYNAMPEEGVEALIQFMQEFERTH
ncbi:MAG: 3-phosphoserine/phosphohydroxythreonine transaminase [Gammaproteobacteria bacterium]